jgi:thiosulfate/3-mercaptopyruvate sulfurtransferase
MPKIPSQRTLQQSRVCSGRNQALFFGLSVLLIVLISSNAAGEYDHYIFLDSLKQSFFDYFLQNGSSDIVYASTVNNNASIIESANCISDEMLIHPDQVTSRDIILDVRDDADSYIMGAIHINYKEFLDDEFAPGPASEISKILGNAGISRNDSVVIYGKCLPCGGGPAIATYGYWIMSCMGHKKVKLLAGGMDAWKSAGKTTQLKPSIRPGTEYSPPIGAEFFPAYDYVKSGNVQIIDARSASEFKLGSIPGAINMPIETILNGDEIKNTDELERIFSGLRKDKPIIVYTNTGVKASVLWFSLKMMGYDAKLYSLADWRLHEKKRANGKSTPKSSDIQ